MTKVSDIVTAYMVETTQDLVRSYTEKGLKASGKYEKGLTYKVEDDGKKITAVIESEGHVWFMEKGRAPNKKQTAQQARSLGHILEQWVRDKGISVNPYAAAWKIVREGIDVPNKNNPGKVVEDVVTNEWYDALVEKLKEHFIFVTVTEVERLFRK
jgi:transposase